MSVENVTAVTTKQYRTPRLTTFGDMAKFTAAGIASMNEGPGVGNEVRTPQP